MIFFPLIKKKKKESMLKFVAKVRKYFHYGKLDTNFGIN